MNKVSLLVAVLAAVALLLVCGGLLAASRLPPTDTYGLPSDVPAYPNLPVYDGVWERLVVAWTWNTAHMHSQPYRLPPDADETQVSAWYDEEMPKLGWERETGLPG